MRKTFTNNFQKVKIPKKNQGSIKWEECLSLKRKRWEERKNRGKGKGKERGKGGKKEGK